MAIFLALALGLTASLTWIARYDPFAPGSYGFAPRVDDGREIDVTWMSAPSGATVWRIPALSARRFTYRVSIRNDGAMPVTVTNVGDARDGGDVLSIRPVGVALDLDRSSAREVPFRVFTLSPGTEAAITMEVVLADCSLTRDTTMTIGPWPIAYSVLGIPRHAEFESDVQIELVGPTTCSR